MCRIRAPTIEALRRRLTVWVNTDLRIWRLMLDGHVLVCSMRRMIATRVLVRRSRVRGRSGGLLRLKVRRYGTLVRRYGVMLCEGMRSLAYIDLRRCSARVLLRGANMAANRYV